MAQDRGAELEALIAQADAGEITRAEAALEKRRRELGLGADGEGVVTSALSDVVERLHLVVKVLSVPASLPTSASS